LFIVRGLPKSKRTHPDDKEISEGLTMIELSKSPKFIQNVLFENEHFEIVKCEWDQDSCSALHGHGPSQCSVLIEEGIFENKTVMGFKTEIEIHKAGEVFTTPLGAEHEIRCVSAKGKTLHVYSPKITKEIATEDPHFKLDSKDQDSLDLSLGESMSWTQVQKLLNQIEKASVTTRSPYFMNQLFSGIHPQTLAAESVMNRTRTTLATNEASPVYSKVEAEVIKMLAKKLGWNPRTSEGLTVAGGSAANMMAIHCARQKLHPETKTLGNQSQKYRIYVSDQAHYSFLKSANALGLGTNSIVSISSDENGRMIPRNLRHQIGNDLQLKLQPLMIAATAGTTVAGAFDPIDELAVVAQDFKIWLHIDAAWGAPAYFSKTKSYLVKGSDQADSLTFDAHKFFGSQLTSTLFITPHQSVLFEANDVKGGEYLFHESEELDRGRISWQCGRGPDVLSFWTLWKNLGDQGLQKSIDEKFELVQKTVQLIHNSDRLKLISNPEFLNICFQVLPPKGSMQDPKSWSVKVREKLILNQQVMVNYSHNENEGYFIRMILAHPQIDVQHVHKIISQILEVD